MKRVIRAAAFVFLLPALTAVFLHTSVAKDLVRFFLSKAAFVAWGADVSIAALDYRLWLAEVEAQELVFTTADRSVALRAARVATRPIGFFRLSVEVAGPELRLRPSETPAAEGAPLSLPLAIGRLEVSDGRVQAFENGAQPWLEMGGLDIFVQQVASGHEGKVRATEGRITAPAGGLPLSNLEVGFTLAGEKLEIAEAQVRSGGSVARAKGTISRLSPFTAKLDFGFEAEAKLAAQWHKRLDLGGRVDGQGGVSAEAGQLTVDASFRSPAVSWEGRGPFSLEGNLELANQLLRLTSLDVGGYGGQARASGRFELAADGRQAVQLRWAELDLDALFSDWGGSPIPLASRFAGDAELRLTGWDSARADGDARLVFSPAGARAGARLAGEMTLRASRGELTFQSENVVFQGGGLTARGTIDKDQGWAARYRIRAEDLGRVAAFLPLAALPEDLGGSLDVEGRVEGPLLTPIWTAVISGRNLTLWGQPVRVVSGGLRGAGGRVRLEEVKFLNQEGELTLQGSFPIAQDAGDWEVEARMRRFPLTADPLGVEVAGHAEGRIRIAGPAGDPDFAVSLKLLPLRIGQSEAGEASLELCKRGARLELDSLYAGWGAGSLEASGTFDLASREVRGRFRASDLQLEELPYLSGRVPELSGRLSFSGELEGPATFPSGRGRLGVEQLSFRGAPLPALRSEIVSDGKEVRFDTLLPDRPLLKANLTLAAPYPVQAAVDLAALPLEALLAAFPQWAEGEPALELAGRLDLSFPAAEPGKLRYLARVDKLIGGYKQIGGGAGAPFRVEGDLELLRIADLELVGTETAIAVAGVVPLAEELGLDLTLRGALRLDLARRLFPALGFAGQANIDLALKGKRSSPEILGDARIEEASLVWGDLGLTDITADFASDARALRLSSLSGKILGGSLEVQGMLPWPGPSPGRAARASFRLRQVDPGELLATSDEEDAGPRPSLRLSGSGTLESEAFTLSALRGGGEIEELRAGWGGLAIEGRGELRWSIADGSIEVPRADLVGGETELQLGAKVRITAAEPEWEASLRGVLDNAVLNPVLEAAGGMLLSGKTRLDVRQKSSPEGPRYSGTGSLEGAQLILREPPLTLSEIHGQIRFEERTLVLSDLTAEAGGGRVSGTGTIELSGVAGVERVDINARAETVRLNYPEGLRSESSGSIRLRGTPDRLVLSGEVRLLQGLYNRNLSLESDLLRSAGREAARLTQQDSFEENVELALRLRTENDLRIDNNLASVETAVGLSVSGTLAAPLVSGILTARSGGSFRLGRNRFQVESGRIDLDEYPLSPPDIQLRARTAVSNVDIVIEVRGTPEDLRTEISAPNNPELTRADLGSLLVTGRPLERVDTQDSRALGQMTASEILGEQLISLFGGALANLATQGLGQALPFDQVAIEPTLLGSEADPGARFTVGKSVTPELFVTYSVGLNDAEKQLWIVDYRLPRNLLLRGVREDDNEFTGGLSQRLPIDLYPRPRGPSPDRAAPRRLASAVIAGEELPVDREELARELRLSAGDSYDYWKAQEAAERIRKKLSEEGFPSAVVEVETREMSRRQVDVVFGVVPGRRFEITWVGDDPGGAVKRLVETTWDGRLPENLLLSELAAAAAGELKRQRYYLAQVTTQAVDSTEARRVSFRVAKGPRGKRVRLEFRGNETLGDDELASVLPRSATAEFFELVTEQPSRARELLRLYYASRGFLQARVDRPQATYDAPSGEFRVQVAIVEGPRAHLEEVAFEGLRALGEGEVRKELHLRAGEPFLLPDYLRDRAALRALYRRRGFVDASIRSRIEQREDRVRVVFEVEEGEPALVGRVRIEGARVTEESLIRRQLTFREGEPLQAAALTESQRQLYDLGVFRAAEVRAEPEEPGARERQVVVEVSETPDLDLNYGLRYNTEDRFEGLAEVRFPNLFGRALALGVTGRINPKQSTILASFHTPFFVRYKLDTDLFLGREAGEDELTTSRVTRFTFQQSRELATKLRLQWSYGFRRIYTLGKVTAASPFPFSFTTDRASLVASLIEDRRDNVLAPARGRFWSVSFEYAPSLLGSDIKFQKFFGQFFYYYSLRPDLVWASGYRIGLAQGFGQSLLKQDRFQAGGSTTVRGFARNSLGPVDPVTDTVIGGEAVLVINQELRFPLYRWFRGVAFYDAGNTFASVDALRLGDLRHNLGVGLRLSFPFGLLRLDWARVLDPRPGEKTSRFFFSLGHAF